MCTISELQQAFECLNNDKIGYEDFPVQTAASLIREEFAPGSAPLRERHAFDNGEEATIVIPSIISLKTRRGQIAILPPLGKI